MTPETPRIDLRFRGVGRINRACGTTNPRTLVNIKRTLRELHSEGRLDILCAIRDGHVSFLEVYDAHRRRALHELPLGETMRDLGQAMAAWIEGATKEYAEGHLENLETARRLFVATMPKARIADLPKLLQELRASYGAAHPRSFNHARGAAQSFVRSTLRKSHPIWHAITDIEPRKIRRTLPKPVITPDRMRELLPHPETDKVDAIAWSIVTTGMGAKEYWGRWSTQSDHIAIAGTKRAGRFRDIPLARVPSVPRLSRDRWQRVFRERMKAQGVAITPYDLRRMYARWLELAGIPRSRRRLYMGHGAKDVTDLYEAHQVTAFLLDDARTLRVYLGLESAASGESSPKPSPIAIAK